MIEPSDSLQQIFEGSVQHAKSLQHEYITIEHILFGIMSNQQSYEMLESFGSDAKFIKSNLDHYLKNNLDDIKITERDYKPKKPTL